MGKNKFALKCSSGKIKCFKTMLVFFFFNGNCENVKNTLKIKVFIKSILLCKYLRNGSSDLYEILCGGQKVFKSSALVQTLDVGLEAWTKLNNKLLPSSTQTSTST